MALQSCYECNKEISTKAIMCPQCGAPQNPASGLMDKVKKGFLGKTFNKVKNDIRETKREKEIIRIIEEDLEKVVQKEIIEGYKKCFNLAYELHPPVAGDLASQRNNLLGKKLNELFKFPCLYLLLNGSDGIGVHGTIIENETFGFHYNTKKEFQVFMEMMGIPSGIYGTELRAWMKLEDIRKTIEESEKKGPTILSRFRPKE
jgi:hypothetical protein